MGEFHMSRSKTGRLVTTILLNYLAILLFMPLQAQASLLGDSVNVSFPTDSSNDIVTVVAGPEFTHADSSSIGNNLLLDGEYIDILESAIVYHVRGNGSIVNIEGVDYISPGFASGHQFVFSDLDFSGIPNAILTGVTVSLTDVINVELGTDVFFNADSVTLNLGRILVKYNNDINPSFGTITMNLQFATAPVPLPGSVIFLVSGLVMLSRGFLTRHKKLELV
jgi:hypothetical protein